VTVDRDFFVSFTGADRPWATWLLAELDAAGVLKRFPAARLRGREQLRIGDGSGRPAGTADPWVLSATALQAPYVRQEWRHD
jgi:hypothetical protein